jgi:type I restriction enzyme, S subunit
MEVRPGYKATEAGVVPEEWEVRTVEQVALVTSGKRLPLGSSLVDHPTPHPYIRVKDMRPGTVDLTEIKYVPEAVFPAIQRYRIYERDIFISVAGSLGIVGKIPKELDGANLTENADRLTNITCSQDYLLYVLMSPLIQTAIDSIRTVGAQPKLALTRIRKFPIPLPPAEAEQRAIAAALSDVDALLGGLDQLIAKKRDLKQAAMQQLLTGQTRLPGFQGEWELKQLGELGRTYGGLAGKTKADFGVGGSLYVTFMAIMSGAEIDGRRLDRVRVAPTETQNVVVLGDLLFNGSSETPEEVAMCSLVTLDVPNLYLNSFCFGFRLRPGAAANGLFLTYLIRSSIGREVMKSLAQGSTRYNLSKRALLEAAVRVPGVEEQTAIATVLSDMDAELSALRARRFKTEALKTAMMQELLTGKTRLV